MDRYLISGVFGLLIFQVLFLLNNLGIIDPLHLTSKSSNRDRQVIGKVIKKRQNVKHKGMDSIIWEDSNPDDALYRFDSVLTLDNSTAQLSVEDNVNLQIQENTLVVLEPIDQNKDESLRVRFFKGQLRSQNRRGLSFGTGGWTMQATPGSDLTLRALSDDRVELEISRGEVALANKQTGENKVFSDGKKLTLGKEKIEALHDVSSNLQIEEPKNARIYSHHFPLFVPISWTGTPNRLHILHPDRREQTLDLTDTSLQLFFPPGTYSLTLEDKDGRMSASKVLEVVPAPRILYLSPLPRDRIELGSPHLFSWYPIENISDYEIKLQSSDENKTQVSKMPNAQILSDKAGEYVWSVYAHDTDGYEVPPFYSLPVYVTPKPLAPPKLHDPTRLLETIPREPATESKSSPPDGAFFFNKVIRTLYSAFIPEAVAEEMRPIEFSWNVVDGAEFYIIEISSKPDFLQPEVMQKITSAEFSWKNYRKQIYYWRVAGGARDGRMGIFSDPSSFDVSKLSERKPGQDGPGFKEAEKMAKPPSVKKEAAPVAITPATPTVPPPTPPHEPTFIEATVLTDYWLMSQKNADVDQVNFKGFATPSFSLAKSWNISQSQYVSEFSYHQLKWEPKSKDTLPFQPTFTTRLMTLKFYGLGPASFHFGFIAKQIPIITRIALEEVETKTETLTGGLINWQASLSSKTVWQSQFSLVYGNTLFLSSIENRVRYNLSERIHVSGLLEFTHAFGDNSQSAQWIRTGLEFGFRW